MALSTENDEAVVKVAVARFYGAPVGTERPADLRDVGVEWNSFGHTTLENIVDLSYEGGERSSIPTLQNPAVRENISDVVESFGVNLLEWTKDSFELYYGSNVVLLDDGAVEIPTKPQLSEQAFLMVIEDGDRMGGFYAARSSAFRNAAVAVADTTSLSSLPVKFTALTNDGAKTALTVIPPKVQEDAL